MQDAGPISQPYRRADLAQRKPTRFHLKPDAAARAALADWLGIEAVEALEFQGEIRPAGKADWRLEGRFAARVVQPCVVTLAPVTSDIGGTVERRYLADMPEPEADEVEIPEDVSAEPLPEVIDPGAVLGEEVALALPLYPRAPGAELGAAQFTEPGKAPLTDETSRPFAGLGALKDKLEGGD